MKPRRAPPVAAVADGADAGKPVVAGNTLYTDFAQAKTKELEVLTVTEAASAHLARMIKRQDGQEGMVVRFVCEGQGIKLRQDSERTGDTTFQHAGRTVLLLDAQVSELLAEDTLDLKGTKLKLRRPKESK